MRKIFCILTLIVFTLQISAQTNETVRLALVSESEDTTSAVSILTAEFSSHGNIQLLERNEIDKAYKEQDLSGANHDYLKLGQILGADGLLLLRTSNQGTNYNLNIRLVAIKPGIVLSAETFTWPIQDLTGWSKTLAKHLDPYLRKLTVASKDAIPLSVVNLRSAINSAAGRDSEQALKVLTIQRLSQEPRLFVLERQRMELLAEEKSLQNDDSAFWRGSYLLEGVIDQNGHSEEFITVNARLTPPQGGTPIPFELKGNRTNLAEVVNQLAMRVNEALKIKSTAPAWSAADEAKQYFDEAQWAMKWGDYKEAQQAVESAWALGRRDSETAILRVHTYMVSADTGKMVVYYPPKEKPDPQTITSTLHALDIYNESSRNLPPDEPKVNSEWYKLGVDNLIVASRVLQVFRYSPEFYEPVAGQLSELRATVRRTAEWISKSPSVHATYFVGDRVATHDELHTLQEYPGIFSVQLDCSSLWQDKPEDCLLVYRELMSSPVFCYFHDRFWFRNTYHYNGALFQAPPRLVAWNAADEKRIPTIWNGFLRELNASSNFLVRLEGKAVTLADTTNEAVMRETFTNLFTLMFEHRDELVSNNVELLYLEWSLGDLIRGMGGNIVTDTKTALSRIYGSDYEPKLKAMDDEYWRHARQMLANQKSQEGFAKQKKYLQDNTPYNRNSFIETFVFGLSEYSTNQALELQPLLAAYKARLDENSAKAAAMTIKQVEFNLNRALNPPAARIKTATQTPPFQPVVTTNLPIASSVLSNSSPEIVTNIITVGKFLAIPLENLPGDRTYAESNVHIQAHHWFEDKLVLDFQYEAAFYSTNENNHFVSRTVILPAIAILEPVSGHWDVISCQEPTFETQNGFYHRTVLLHGELFNSDCGQIKKYDFKKRQWVVLPVSDGSNYELFALNGSLYAANANVISKIIDDGKASRLLASTRRQPPASKLDSQVLGMPILFEGPDHSVRASISGHVFTWTNTDWEESAPPIINSWTPEIFASGLLFRQKQNWQDPLVCISLLANSAREPEVCFWKKLPSPIKRSSNPIFQRPTPKPPPPPTPVWDLPTERSLPQSCAALREMDLFFMVDHSVIQKVVGNDQVLVSSKAVAKDGYGAILYCFSHDIPDAVKLYLKFDSSDNCPPGIGGEYMPPEEFKPPTWITFGGDNLFFGLEKANKFSINGNQRTGIGCKAGVWMLPTSQLDSALAEQKRIRKAEKTNP